MDLSSTKEKKKKTYKNCGKQGHYIKEYKNKYKKKGLN